MKKTIKQEHKSPDDVKLELVEEREQITDKACSEEIELVLKKYNRALQPFLGGGDVAIMPRVRLVRVTPKEQDEETPTAD